MEALIWENLGLHEQSSTVVSSNKSGQSLADKVGIKAPEKSNLYENPALVSIIQDEDRC
jgi:hypothetical protein